MRVAKLPRDEKSESLRTLKQSTSTLVLKALQAGATPQDILTTVGVSIDRAAEIYQTHVQIVLGPRIVRRGQ
jgi:hypothetical protein